MKHSNQSRVDVRGRFSRRHLGRARKLIPEQRLVYAEIWCSVFEQLLRMGHLHEHSEPDADGWFEVRCPWMHRAAMQKPIEENGYVGAFRCPQCADRDWADLLAWLDLKVLGGAA